MRKEEFMTSLIMGILLAKGVLTESEGEKILNYIEANQYNNLEPYMVAEILMKLD